MISDKSSLDNLPVYGTMNPVQPGTMKDMDTRQTTRQTRAVVTALTSVEQTGSIAYAHTYASTDTVRAGKSQAALYRRMAELATAGQTWPGCLSFGARQV